MVVSGHFAAKLAAVMVSRLLSTSFVVKKLAAVINNCGELVSGHFVLQFAAAMALRRFTTKLGREFDSQRCFLDFYMQRGFSHVQAAPHCIL
jgi:hypothetical protein